MSKYSWVWGSYCSLTDQYLGVKGSGGTVLSPSDMGYPLISVQKMKVRFCWLQRLLSWENQNKTKTVTTKKHGHSFLRAGCLGDLDVHVLSQQLRAFWRSSNLSSWVSPMWHFSGFICRMGIISIPLLKTVLEWTAKSCAEEGPTHPKHLCFTI